MAENSSIEWTDHTFNPWEGCTKVSPGCANCYAEALRDIRYGAVKWGKGQPRRRTAEANWKKPLQWNREAALWRQCETCGHRGKADESKGGPLEGMLACEKCNAFEAHLVLTRPRVFCASLADWLDDEVPIEWLADLLDLIRQTPNLDWLLLTKRPENFSTRMAALYESIPDSPLWHWLRNWFHFGTTIPEGIPGNVWIGTTVEDQTRADERIPELLRIPAKVRFLSCEPLLRPVDIRFGLHFNSEASVCPKCMYSTNNPARDGGRCPNDGTHLGWDQSIDWVIAGGESGHGARPMDPGWARSLRDQCAAVGVPFLFKQWGEWAPTDGKELCGPRLLGMAGGQMMKNVGKKAAGRLLDGVEHNGFPTVLR